MTRRYWQAVDEPERTIFVARQKAYHGMHAGGTSLVGIPAMNSGYGELINEVVHVPWDSVELLERAIEEHGPSHIAGVFCEPVMGVGGVLHAASGLPSGPRASVP